VSTFTVDNFFILILTDIIDSVYYYYLLLLKLSIKEKIKTIRRKLSPGSLRFVCGV